MKLPLLSFLAAGLIAFSSGAVTPEVGKFYRFENRGYAGYNLTGNGSGETVTCTAADENEMSQIWEALSTPSDQGTYLRNVSSGYYLYGVGYGQQSQPWTAKPDADTTYSPLYFTEEDGYTLVRMGTSYDYAYLHCKTDKYCVGWTKNDAPSTYWTVTEVTDKDEEIAAAKAKLEQAVIPEAGKFYRFENRAYQGYNITGSGAGRTVTCTAADENAMNQIWEAETAADGSGTYLRNVFTGNYLYGVGWDQSSYPWTSNAEPDDVYSPLSFTKEDGYTLVRISGTSYSYAYLHCDASKNCVGWEKNNSPSTYWSITEVTDKADEIAAAKANVNALNELTDAIDSFNALFADGACTRLNPEADYSGLPDRLKAIAEKVNSGDWSEGNWDSDHAKKYRVQLYEPYSDAQTTANWLGLNPYTNMNNPTGIVANENDVLLVMVDDLPAEGASLRIGYATSTSMANNTSSAYTLSKGLNVIPIQAENDAAYYIYYVVNTIENGQPARKLSDYPDIKIHIEGGSLNGFYNTIGDALYTPDTQDDWFYTSERATHTMFDLIGRACMLHFNLNELTDGGLSLRNILTREKMENQGIDVSGIIDTWDKIVLSEFLVMGLLPNEDTQGELAGGLFGMLDDEMYEYVNCRMLALSNAEAGMNATNWRAYFGAPHFDGVLNGIRNKDNLWGPAHEFGHMNQGPINIAGCTEISNNVFSNVANYLLTDYTSRTDLPSKQLDHFYNGDPFLSNGTWGATRMYWQLFVYYHIAGHNRNFYPNLFRQMREDPMSKPTYVNASTDLLKFYINCCKAAGEDLTTFFESWGFFRELDNYYIGDYSTYYLTCTAEDIANAKSTVAALNLPVNEAIILIDDRPGSDRQNYSGDMAKENAGPLGGIADFTNPATPSGDPTLTVNGTTLTVNGVSGGVGVIVKDNEGNLLAFNNSYEFEIPIDIAAKILSGQAQIAVIGADNTQITASEEITEDSMEAWLTTTRNDILNYVSADETQVGYYRPQAVEAVRKAYNNLSEEMTRENLSVLVNAITDLTAASDTKVSIIPDNKYRLVNRSFPTAALNAGLSYETGTDSRTDNAYLWLFEDLGNGSYALRNAETDLYIQPTANDENSSMGETAAPYTLTELSTGVFALSSNGDTNCSLNLNSGRGILGWTYVNDLGSHWSITLISDETKPPTSITAVEIDTPASQTIYDLHGRRLLKISRPGIYIVNGTKKRVL